MLLCLAMACQSGYTHAQPPTVTWDEFFPGTGDYELGNYTANDIKENPHGGYVLVGSRKIQATNGYSELLLMRVDEEGDAIRMLETLP